MSSSTLNVLLELIKKHNLSLEDITTNHKKVREKSIFFAIKGSQFDGHSFLKEVLKKKPLAVVIEKNYLISNSNDTIFGVGKNKKEAKQKTLILRTENTRKLYAELLSRLMGEPYKKMKIFGITGTDGKTSTAYILYQIINILKGNCGYIGTLGVFWGDNLRESYNSKTEKKSSLGWTTPPPEVWFKTLQEMYHKGIKFISAEISSHALAQYRIYPTEFEAIGFTNLSEEHLDFHQSMEEYFQAKRKLFKEYSYRIAVVNGDDYYGERLLREFPEKCLSFGKKKSAHYQIVNYQSSLEGSTVLLKLPNGKKIELKIPLPGEFQVYNTVLAFSLLHSSQLFSEEELQEAIKHLKPIEGRFEIIYRKDFTVIVDYAHTPKALKKLLQSIKKIKKEGRLIVIFGAGGNRDRSKRPLMGKYAEELADIVVLTSDNPRWEDPYQIIRDILKGIRNPSKILIEVDRKKAIEKVLKDIAKKGDLVVIAGKGHEDYQEIKGIKYPFKDKEVVLNEILLS